MRFVSAIDGCFGGGRPRNETQTTKVKTTTTPLSPKKHWIEKAVWNNNTKKSFVALHLHSMLEKRFWKFLRQAYSPLSFTISSVFVLFLCICHGSFLPAKAFLWNCIAFLRCEICKNIEYGKRKTVEKHDLFTVHSQ